MPVKLPSVQSLGDSPTPRPQRDIQSYRAGQVENVAIEAAEGLSRTGLQMMRAGEQVQDRVDRLEYSRAKSAFLREKVAADNSFSEDQDYSTFETRYRERLGKSLAESSKRISNGAVREAFAAEAGLDFERGIAGIQQLARGKEKDANRAFLNEELTANLQTALQADRATANGILDSVTTQINASKDKGYLTAQEAQKLSRDFAANYAVSRIQMLPHEEQVKLLSTGMTAKEGALPVFSKQNNEVDFIPPDKRVELLRAAEAKDKQRQAIALSDQITGPMGSGMDLSGWMKKAQDIKDPLLREAVESRVTTEFNRRSALKTEGERNARAAIWEYVDRDKSLDNVPMSLLNTMPAQERVHLKDYVEKLGRIPFNEALDIDLNIMRVQDPERFRSLDLNEYRGRLNAEQIQKFGNVQIALNSKEAKDAEKAAKEETLRASAKTAINLLRGTLESAGVDPTPKANDQTAKDRLAAFEGALITRLDQFQTEKKGKATEKEIKGIVDGLLMEGKISKNWWPDSSKRVFELTDEDREKFYVPFSTIPPKDKALITQALQQAGQPVTNEAVEQLYARHRMQGATSGR